MDANERRAALIRAIEQERGSRVIVYFTGDRSPFPARVAEDAVLPMYYHLLATEATTGKPKKVDLVLYTRGGDVSVPWRVVSMMREFSDRFDVLIPYKAHSAGTMIALGADKICMGKKAELSPIDPTLSRKAAGGTAAPSEISVEDVSSYISFMRERARITDQTALAQLMCKLAEHLTPLALGSVNRQYSHIRLVALKLLSSRNRKLDEGKAETIIEALTEKMYSHGHAIGRKEARELGLPVEVPAAGLEETLWDLYREYEVELKLNEPLDAEAILVTQKVEEHSSPGIPIAVIESARRLDVFEMDVVFRWKRRSPSNPQISVNMNLSLPPSVDPGQLPQQVQQVLQQLLNQVGAAIPRIVQQEMARQAPVEGIEVRTYGGRWKEKPRATAGGVPNAGQNQS